MSTPEELKDSLYSILKELGLKSIEIDLYTVSLSVGPSTIVNLSKYLGIPRPNVYKVIGALEKHGLARFGQRKKYARTFVVEPPAVLLEKLRLKKEAISQLTHTACSLMPDLYGLYQQGSNQTRIKVLRTESEYIAAVQGMLNEVKNNLCFFGSFENFIKTISPEVFNKFTSLRVVRKIETRSLILPTEFFDELKKYEERDYRKVRILKNSIGFKTSFQISKHSAIIWQPVNPMAILIEDDFIVQMLQAMFDLLWIQSE